MARSVYIWLVLGSEREPLAAFTVKHELITWLERCEMNEDNCTLWKIADNGLIDQSMFTNPTDNVRRITLEQIGVR
jgi:hypothetical protein